MKSPYGIWKQLVDFPFRLVPHLGFLCVFSFFQGKMYDLGPGLMDAKVNQSNYYATSPWRLKLFLAWDTFTFAKI